MCPERRRKDEKGERRERERERTSRRRRRKKEDQDAGCRSSFNNNDYLRPRSIDVDV